MKSTRAGNLFLLLAVWLGVSTVVHAQATLVARLNFETAGFAGEDSSGNGNDQNGGSSWGSPEDTNDVDAAVGAFARRFYGVTSITWSPPADSFTNVWSALAGSFSVSAWVRTTASRGSDTDHAVDGQTIVWAYNDSGNVNDLIPIAMTGNKAAFFTRDHLGAGSTLHSTANVNDGDYHLITVTRNQTNGVKRLYVDGVLDASETGTTNLLNGNDYYLSVGGTIFSPYTGLVDDVRIYSGVLSASEVANLAAAGPHPSRPSLVAHYTFDESFNLGGDSSTNGHDFTISVGQNGGGILDTNDAIAGDGAVEFSRDLGDPFSAAGYSWSPSTPPAMLSTLAGSFSVSVWVKTTNTVGSQGDFAFDGAAILAADVDGPNNDVIPIALTGGQVAINVGDATTSLDSTLNSSATVNDGNWHHVVVMRNQSNGVRQIYIDNVLDSYDVATTNLLNDPQLAFVGAIMNAANSSPTNGFLYAGYSGELDDLQIYSEVLTPADVSTLYHTPGLAVPASGFNTALNTTNLPWNTGGDSVWFVETNNTQDAEFAAQSGSVTGEQVSVLAVTIDGPGTLDFYWSSFAEDTNGGFYAQFDINGNYEADIFGDSSWSQYGPIILGPGPHTLTWTAYANGDTDPTQAVFLDQVTFTPYVPQITNVQRSGQNLQFSFQTLDTLSHTVETSTNLASGVWTALTNFTGDGSLKAFSYSITNAPAQFFRVKTQ